MRRCPTCHGETEECGDADKVWHMRREVCHKTIAAQAAKRIHDLEYEKKQWHDGTFTTWAEKFSEETPNHFLDGVTVWVSETPDPKYASAGLVE